MLPFIGLTGVSLVTNMIGMTLFLLLFAGSLILLGRAMEWQAGWICALTVLPLLIVSSSDKLREIFWGHIIYYSLGVFFLFLGLALVFFTLRALEGPAGVPEGGAAGRKGGWRLPLLLGGTGLWFLLCSLNGLQALTIFALPAIAGVAGERLLDVKNRISAAVNRRAGLLLGTVTAATLLGFLLGQWLGRDIPAGYAAAYSGFESPDAWITNLSRLLPHWMTLLGVSVEHGDPFMSADGIVNLLRLAFGLLLAVIPAVMLFFYRRFSRWVKILLLAHWAMTALILLAYVFGLLSAANWRLSPIVGTSAVLVVAFAQWIWQTAEYRRFSVLLLFPTVLFGLLSAAAIIRMPADYNLDTGVNAVADYLVEQDLTYGYGTFWNAQCVTVLSDSKAKVRSVNITGSGVTPYSYQGQDAWYEPQEGQETYFLLLTKAEYQSMEAGGNPLLAQASGRLTFQDYEIVLLDFCPFA